MSARIPVGSTVRVVSCSDLPRLVNRTGELVLDERDHQPYKVKFDTTIEYDTDTWWFYKGDIEIVNSVHSVNDFTVGEKVIVLHRNPEDHGYVSKGAIGEIVDIDASDDLYPIRVKFSGNQRDSLKPDQLDKVSTPTSSLSGFSVGDKVTVVRRTVFDRDFVEVGAQGEVTKIQDDEEYPIQVKFAAGTDDLKVDQLVKRQTYRDIRVGDRVEITDARKLIHLDVREGDRGTVTDMGFAEKNRYVKLDRTGDKFAFNAETQLRKVTNTETLAKGDRVQIVDESGARAIGATVRHGDTGEVTSVDYGGCSVKMDGSRHSWSLMNSHVAKIPTESLKVGDRVKVADASGARAAEPTTRVNNGDTGTVKYVSTYTPTAMDVSIDGRERSCILHARHVEKIETESLNVGDSVEITNLRGRTLYSDKGTGMVRVGDRGTITRRSYMGHRWIVNLPQRNYRDGGYAFAERDLRKVEPTPVELKIGDRVRVTDLRGRHMFRGFKPQVCTGDTGTVTRRTLSGTTFVHIPGKSTESDPFSFRAADLTLDKSELTVNDLPTGTRVRIDDFRGRRIRRDRVSTRDARVGDHGTIINPGLSPSAGKVWVSIDHVTAADNSYQFEPAQLSKLDVDKRIGDLKVGDRVRVTDAEGPKRYHANLCVVGAVGTITKILDHDTRSDCPLDVTWDEPLGHIREYAMSAEHLAPLVRVWKKETPSEPVGVTAVAPVLMPTEVYRKHTSGRHAGKWLRDGKTMSLTWSRLIEKWVDGVQEVVDTEYERAVRWFKENPGQVPAGGFGNRGDHLRAIVEYAVEQSDKSA